MATLVASFRMNIPSRLRELVAVFFDLIPLKMKENFPFGQVRFGVAVYLMALSRFLDDFGGLMQSATCSVPHLRLYADGTPRFRSLMG